MKRGGAGALLMLVVAMAMPDVAGAADLDRPPKVFSEKQLAQQQRMKDCAADAKEKALKGADRPAFMKTCLAGGSVTVAVGSETASAPDDTEAAARAKAKACRAGAREKALQGAERKAFMSECLGR